MAGGLRQGLAWLVLCEVMVRKGYCIFPTCTTLPYTPFILVWWFHISRTFSMPCSILIATTNRTFSGKSAEKELGYKPNVNMDEAVKRMVGSFSHLKNTGEWPGPVSNKKSS